MPVGALDDGVGEGDRSGAVDKPRMAKNLTQ